MILILSLGAFAVSSNPVHSKIFNLSFLVCVLGIWVGSVALAWNRKLLRIAILSLPFLAALPFLLPDREISTEQLRQDYVRRMSELEGTKYRWGGEASHGIDCSGLPRLAYRNALLAHGIKHFDGRAFREYFEQWWFDASAKALGSEYRNYTSPVGTSGTIKAMDYSTLLPGDLAVTTNGLHVLAYVGANRWIQADPGIGSVATLDGRADDNIWFRTPVTTHRWTFLRAARSGNRQLPGTF